METVHNSLNNLCNTVIERIPKKESGTYNRQDPTYFEKGSTYVQWKDKWWRLKYNDCTWGVEITLYRIEYWDKGSKPEGTPKDNALWKGIKLGGFYITTEQEPNGSGGWKHVTKVIPRQKPKGLVILMYHLSRLLPEPVEEVYYDDPMGCPSDYI